MPLLEALAPIDHATASIADGDLISLAVGRRGELAGGVVTRKAATVLCRQLMAVLGIAEAPPSADVIPFPVHKATPPRQPAKKQVAEL